MDLKAKSPEVVSRQLQQLINLKNSKELKIQNFWPLQRNVFQNLLTESDVPGESYAESSSTSLQRQQPVNKLYTSKAIRKMMEIRRIQLHNLPTHSSDSSFEEDRSERSKCRYLKRKSKLERDIFWKKFNDFLTRSIDYMESNRSSSSDS
ncbi:hypothetical protein FF38_07795 [Lucilia cuprina]|uniref:Uncharacterized protein n=1 Tax=Lucilia cuprina TaxID=7375 RepID=A0A0L0BYL6_LUCCU|nr:hypothetical protein FF38_07795 [Lucilia cuprina]